MPNTRFFFLVGDERRRGILVDETLVQDFVSGALTVGLASEPDVVWLRRFAVSAKDSAEPDAEGASEDDEQSPPLPDTGTSLGDARALVAFVRPDLVHARALSVVLHRLCDERPGLKVTVFVAPAPAPLVT